MTLLKLIAHPSPVKILLIYSVSDNHRFYFISLSFKLCILKIYQKILLNFLNKVKNIRNKEQLTIKSLKPPSCLTKSSIVLKKAFASPYLGRKQIVLERASYDLVLPTK